MSVNGENKSRPNVMGDQEKQPSCDPELTKMGLCFNFKFLASPSVFRSLPGPSTLDSSTSRFGASSTATKCFYFYSYRDIQYN